MLASLRPYLSTAALALLIFAINLTGDGLRDVISPEGRT